MFLQYCYGFFLNDDSLFFITNDGIMEMGRTFPRTKMLDIPTNGNIAFDGRTISDCVYLCGKDGAGCLKISNDAVLSVDYDGEKVTMILKSDGKEVVFKP